MAIVPLLDYPRIARTGWSYLILIEKLGSQSPVEPSE